MLVLDSKSIADFVMDRIEKAEIVEEPFPHFIVEELFPDAFFQDLLKNFPDRSQFQEVTYPGTGHGKRTSLYRESGFAFKDMKSHEILRIVDEIFGSAAFSRALLDKFSKPLADGFVPIPLDKHKLFKDGATDFACVYDFQIDVPGYEIPPHPDVPDKIVTFQYFLVDDDSVRDYGTMFCRPKNGKKQGIRRPFLQRAMGRLINEAATRTRFGQSSLYRRLEQSPLGLWMGVGTTRNWLPWGMVDVVKMAHALPNHFMAFAPNEFSYHAVRMDIPPECKRQERPVVRGFIRKGRAKGNWIQSTKM